MKIVIDKTESIALLKAIQSGYLDTAKAPKLVSAIRGIDGMEWIEALSSLNKQYEREDKND